jgi:hypothetical protein
MPPRQKTDQILETLRSDLRSAQQEFQFDGVDVIDAFRHLSLVYFRPVPLAGTESAGKASMNFTIARTSW